MAKMPEQKPGRSEQSVATPADFLAAVKNRLNIQQFTWDLAASDENTVVPPTRIVDFDGNVAVLPHHYTEEDDALAQEWNLGGWCWLNPPYSDIRPWVLKAQQESEHGAHIAMLVPASTGSNWWNEHVDGIAYITFLNGRITFVGHKSPYPKDLALLLYAPFLKGGSTYWRWK